MKTLKILLLIMGFSFIIGNIILICEYSEKNLLGLFVGFIIIVLDIALFKLKKEKSELPSKKWLSSRITILIKIFLLTMLTFFNVVVFIFTITAIFKASYEYYVPLILFLVFTLIISYIELPIYLNLKEILYDDNSIYIFNKNKYEQIKIEEILKIKAVIPNIYMLKLKDGRKIFFAPSIINSLNSLGFSSTDIKFIKEKLKKKSTSS